MTEMNMTTQFREGSKRQIYVTLMRENPDMPMNDMVHEIMKAIDVPENVAKMYYVWAVEHNVAPGNIIRTRKRKHFAHLANIPGIVNGPPREKPVYIRKADRVKETIAPSDTAEKPSETDDYTPPAFLQQTTTPVAADEDKEAEIIARNKARMAAVRGKGGRFVKKEVADDKAA